MSNVRIENWSITSKDSPFVAPELRTPCLQGDVYGHPRLGDMTGVVTSRIVDVKGNIITTRSGTVYELGEPEPEFIEWCKANGVYVPTKEAPIKV